MSSRMPCQRPNGACRRRCLGMRVCSFGSGMGWRTGWCPSLG
jgi:hypothetical protein